MEKNAFFGIMIALSVIAANLIPMILSLLIFWDTRAYCTKIWKHTAAVCICACIHICSYLLIHEFFLGYWNFLYTIRRVMSFDFTYQDIDYFSYSLFARSFMAIAVGFFIRIFLFRGDAGRNRCMRLPRKRIALLYATFSVVGVLVIGTLYYSFSGIQNIVINEIGSNNVSVALDDDGTIGDYVELYNKGNLACVAEHLYLSDSDMDLKREEIARTVIPAKGYLIVKLENGNGLRIKKEGGETIYLSNAWGRILDQVSTVAIEPDFSFCRVDDIGEEWAMLTATPGDTNSNGKVNDIVRLHTVPVFSHASGFYEDAFDLQIKAEDGVTIYYTLDGSIPTAESEIYSKPIRVYNRSDEPNQWRSQQRVLADWQNYRPDTTPVDKAFIIRAIAIDESGAVSEPVTASYFVGLEAYKENAVVSLVVDPEDFWGEDGIYVTGRKYDSWYAGDKTETALDANYLKRGRAWERPAYFIYLSDEGSFEQNIGVRVSGGSSRERILKSFSLYSREAYSESRVFEKNIFENVQSEKLAIRGGFANSICQMLVPDRNFGTQQMKRVSVFLNGEFWYNSNVMEKYDAQYFYEHYGVDPDNVVIMKDQELDEGIKSDELLLNEIYDYISSHDLSDSEAYAGFTDMVDIQSYIDYMCFNIYIDNMDFMEIKNSVWWRSRGVTSKPYEDGKWRFLLYDLDAMEWADAHMWGVESQAEKNSFALTPRYTRNQAINQQPLFTALKANPEFVKQFAVTFMDLVNTNFQYENVQAVLDEYGRNIDHYHSGNGGTQAIEYYEEFFMSRASHIVPYMAEEFSLTGTLETLQLGTNDNEAGYIRLNTITPDLSAGDWSGQYYTDFPVTVTAVAKEGYVFKGWRGSVDSREESLEVKLSTGGTSLYAVFEKEAS